MVPPQRKRDVKPPRLALAKPSIPTAKQIGNKPKMLWWVSVSVGDRRHGSREAVSQHGKTQSEKGIVRVSLAVPASNVQSDAIIAAG